MYGEYGRFWRTLWKFNWRFKKWGKRGKLLEEHRYRVQTLGEAFAVMSTGELEKLQDRVAITLCHLERIFPSSFFDIMEHLVVHLAEEATIGGPSQYRSMWSFERYLLTLKNYVRSTSCPEGSIAEGYWIEECMTFCSRYLHDVETKLSRPLRNYASSNEAANQEGRRSSKEIGFRLDDITHAQARRYV
ncbi:PREDICTED: uncharacterized protein LOC109216379 isoform X2 [Nicotiana attenuata]|uniref:uncharacterized protein LOC109216379 isoform X2 n=1 Tax=Nicotiana attenuata TaxID=49451 RepID=UPI0009056A9F|nr:PREDICTED: uncharacterized protein LOC109216379 isoform X2 [Nicotiana attenuata]